MKNPSTFSANSHIAVIGNTQTGHHYWIGRCADGSEHYAGQTFKSYKAGQLKNIRIFAEMIVGKTDALLSVFEFDPDTREWKEKKGECVLSLDKTYEKQWVSFDMQNIPVDNRKHYAFKISCNHGGMMAIGECSWKQQDPYPDGEEWIASSINPKGKFHRNFDLSFVAEIAYN